MLIPAWLHGQCIVNLCCVRVCENMPRSVCLISCSSSSLPPLLTFTHTSSHTSPHTLHTHLQTPAQAKAAEKEAAKAAKRAAAKEKRLEKAAAKAEKVAGRAGTPSDDISDQEQANGGGAGSSSLHKSLSQVSIRSKSEAAAAEEDHGRSTTGVLASHPQSRDIQIDSFTLLYHGHELLQDTRLELNFGRRYGLLGLNGCGRC